MDISKYIYDYLMEGNTSVVVPDLGCFSIVDKPSVLQDNIVIPPVKTVVLDSENSEDDHVFTRYIADKENITIEQAGQEVYKFYNHFFRQKLANSIQPIIFENFGTFSKNDSGDIQFEPVPDFFKDNYGLGPVPISTAPSSFESAPVISEPVASEPTITVESEQVQSPSETDANLLDPSDHTRFRENKERRRSVAEVPPEPPKQPKSPKPSKSPKQPKPPKQPKEKKTGNSNLWVLWVFLIAVGLGVAGFYFSEISMFFTNNKILTKGRPVTVIAEPEANPEYADETDENIPNAELSQTLDEATDKKNALNPAENQQTVTSTSQPEVAATTSQTESKPEPVVQSRGNAGSDQWALIAGSFKIQSNAEAFQRTLRAEGFSTEIILARNQLYWVSIGSFDTLAEAQRQANQMKSKREVWVAKKR